MIPRNLRHLRILLAIGDTKSVSRAAALCHVSQPAATQALSKLEREAGVELFNRKSGGLFPTTAGQLLLVRARRAIERLDRVLENLSPRLKLTATYGQLQAVVAVTEAENYSLAASRMGMAQPTLHRAVSQIAKETDKLLFNRTGFGLVATRACRDLALAVRLAETELEQADAELAELDGQEVGSITIGALPLSRSSLLPEALTKFRKLKPKQTVTIVDGTYEDLLRRLLRGEIDVLVGAMRDPVPVADVEQEVLFKDNLSILVRPGHELEKLPRIKLTDLTDRDWVVPRTDTPAREQFDAVFAVEAYQPRSVIETGSILLMRELLKNSHMVGCISLLQARAEVSRGLLAQVKIDLPWKSRPIGLTVRKDFEPTNTQSVLLELLRSTVPMRA